MMVSEYNGDQLLLVLQIDHSRVAGLLAAHWGNSMFAPPNPYTSIVLAAQEHDNGWWDWEIKPSTLNDKGYPLDYHDGSLKYLGQLRLDFYKRGVRRLAEQDPYAGLLVLLHGIGLLNAHHGRLVYPPDRSADPRVQEYIEDQERLRARLVEEVRSNPDFAEVSTEEQIWKNYVLVEVCDQLAQFLCNRYPLSRVRPVGPPETLGQVQVSVRPGHPDVALAVKVVDGHSAVIRPYPFDVDPLVISFPGRLVPKKPYLTGEDFLPDFYKAERTMITYSLRSGGM